LVGSELANAHPPFTCFRCRHSSSGFHDAPIADCVVNPGFARYNLSMPNRPPTAFRVGSILWALGLGAVVIVLGATIILPSTKKAHIHLRPPGTDGDATVVGPTTVPDTQP
jgi:hypothetical protein